MQIPLRSICTGYLQRSTENEMKKGGITQSSADDYWRNDPDVIKRFLQQQGQYQQLCAEVEYILRKRIGQLGIEIAHTTSRAKTLNSFLEKLTRKSYGNPFEEITDFAGVRIVCLYRSDLAQLEKMVTDDFRVVKRIDKLRDMPPSEFGYGAIHYVVRLGKSIRGARYDDLKDLLCEIQLRTVLQDAWAIIDHHLIYKQESDVPSILMRKLNGLSGLFETADDSFDNIRSERLRYLKEVEASVGSDEEFLSNELNRDTFISFLKWKFPNLPPHAKGQSQQIGHALDALRDLKGTEMKTIRDLNTEYEKVKTNSDEVQKLLIANSDYAKAGCIRLKYSLALLHDEILSSAGTPSKWTKIIRTYMKTIKSSNKSIE